MYFSHKVLTLLIMCTNILLCSNNCNGLTCIDKIKKYNSVIENRRLHILSLQETFWDDENVEQVKREINCQLFFNNGINKRKGVAIFVNKKYNANLVQKDNIGRFLHINVEIENEIYNIVNIYAPNNRSEKHEFFKYVNNKIKDYKNLICMGDFNCTLSSLDRCGKTEHVNDTAYKELKNMMYENDIVDIYRDRYPNKVVFSFKRLSNNSLQQSRIDHMLISRELSVNIQNMYYNDTSLSDHSFMYLKCDFSNVERGPGVWILNNSLLQDEVYVEKVKELIRKETESDFFHKNVTIAWDNLKYKIKKFSQVYSKNMSKIRYKEYFDIQNELQKLSAKAANGLDIDYAKYESLKLELKNYEETKCKGAILRSKAFWATEYDKNTKYFLNLEKHRQECNSVKEVFNKNGDVVQNSDDILDVEFEFYKDLYDCVSIKENKVTEILQNITDEIDESSKEICDSDITIDEIEKALYKMSKNKSPGSDGLTVEFYCRFFKDLKFVFLKVFTEIEKEGLLCRSMRGGILSLIYKNRGDRRSLMNYRPISLLQVDYKILARIMSNRFKTVLPSIVSYNQSCCIMGRDIADTICSIRDVIELCDNEQIEGYLLKLDQEKAFDRVSHFFLQKTLEKFGFGEKFRNWIDIFYTDICSSVKCNGFLTKYFPVKNGIRQGCPISALLYVLTAEVLNRVIVSNQNIEGIHLPGTGKISLIFQHADDTTLTLGNKSSICQVFDVLQLYSDSSGAKINKNKSEIFPLGTGDLVRSEIESHGLKISLDYVQVLGVYLGKNKSKCEELNWKGKCDKIKNTLNIWNQRCLTFHGRAIVLSTLCMSRLWYTLSVVNIPKWAIVQLKQLCINFLWKNKKHLVNYETIICDKSEGGLKIPDIYLKMLSFRLKFLKKFFDTENLSLWKDIFKIYLRKIGNLQLDYEVFTLKLNKENITCLPTFYQCMLNAFKAIQDDVLFNYDYTFIYNQSLFLNDNITNEKGKPLYWKHFISAGIVQLKNICYEVKPGLLPVHAVVDVITDIFPYLDVNILHRQYELLVKFIPDSWTDVVRNSDNFPVCNNIPTVYIKRGTNCRDLLCHKTRDFYNCLIAKCKGLPVAQEYWTETHDLTSVTFGCVWTNISNRFKSPDIIENDFKIAHNVLFTKDKLFRFNITDNDICEICNTEKEDMYHLFIGCQHLGEFHSYISKLLEVLFENSESQCSISYKQFIFLGCDKQFKHVNVFFLNFLLSVARFSIVRRRNLVMNDSYVSIVDFFKYILKHYISFYHIYLQDNKNLFQKKFLTDNNLVKETNDVLLFIL